MDNIMPFAILSGLIALACVISLAYACKYKRKHGDYPLESVVVSATTNLGAASIGLFIFFYGNALNKSGAEFADREHMHIAAVAEMRRVSIENQMIDKVGPQLTPLYVNCTRNNIHTSSELYSDVDQLLTTAAVLSATNPMTDDFIRSSREEVLKISPMAAVLIDAIQSRSIHLRTLAFTYLDQIKSTHNSLIASGFYTQTSVSSLSVNDISKLFCRATSSISSYVIANQVLATSRMLLICSLAFLTTSAGQNYITKFRDITSHTSDHTASENVFDMHSNNRDFFALIKAEGADKTCPEFVDIDANYKLYEPFLKSGTHI